MAKPGLSTKREATAALRRRKTTIERLLRQGYGPIGIHSPVGAAMAETARRLQVSESVLSRQINSGKLIVDWKLFKPHSTATGAAGKPVPPDERQRMSDRLQASEREKKAAMRKLIASEDLRAAAFGLASRPLTPAALDIKVRRRGKSMGETGILFTSDFQWGEVIDIDEMEGLNRFDRLVASARYKRLIDSAINLSTNHRSTPLDRFIYLRGGDAISGEIHDELSKTNDLLSIPAVRDLAEHEAAGIEKLADALGCPVEVISIPGNHGRNTRKPEAKKFVETNYEDIISWYIEKHFQIKGDRRVTFRAPRSGDALFKVYNWQFLLAHGDRIGSRGGQGFVGPAATIARGMKKTYDYYATQRKIIDYILVGHYHTPLMLEYGYANGCLPGPSEYSRDLKCKPQPPTQWLLNVHPKRGITSQWQIHVGGDGEGTVNAMRQLAA